MGQISKQDFKKYFDFAFEAYEFHHASDPNADFGADYLEPFLKLQTSVWRCRMVNN